MLGVDAIVSGTITDLANHVAVNARLVATDTAAVFASASEEIEKDEDVRSIMGLPGSQPLPGATPVPRPSVASLEQNEFLFVAKGCVRRGDRISCSWLVTNKADKPRNFAIYGGEWTTAIDNNGNSYKSAEISIGRAGLAGGGVQLMPELPMNFFVTFSAVEQSATTINLVLGYGGDGVQPWPSKALFRNISLAQK